MSSSPLPPDPYAALNLSKDATSNQIKTTYRKLVLKCHPDKVTDPALKEKASDDFHRIQQAYEILGDDDRRSRYDAQVKLAELRKDVMEKQRAAGPRSARTTAYDSPAANTSIPRAERIYEERKPTKVYEPDYEYFPEQRGVPRKHEDYERTTKRASPREEREKDKGRTRPSARPTKESERGSREDRRKTRDKETRRERESKYSAVVGDDTDPEDLARRSKYSTDRLREEDVQRVRERERADQDYRDKVDRERERDRLERDRERAREREYASLHSRKQRERPSREDLYDDRSRKQYSVKDDDKYYQARSYIDQKERGHARPAAASRTTSSRDAPYVERTREGTPIVVRSSVRPGRSSRDPSPPPSASRRDRERKHSIPEIPEYIDHRERTSSRDPRTPNLPTASSSPAAIRTMRERGPIRMHSLHTDFDHPSPQHVPQMYRSDTMPNIGLGTTSPRRKDSSAYGKSSHLRNTEINEGGLPTPSTTPDYSPSTTRTAYRYEPVIGDLDLSNGKRTVLREPAEYDRERRHVRPASPPPRHPRTVSARHSAAPPPPPPLRTSQTTSYYPSVQTESPTSYSARPSPIRREASDRLYADLPKSATTTTYDHPSRDRDPPPRQKYPTDPEATVYAKRFGLEDARMQSGYSSSSRRGDSGGRPAFSRAHTSQAAY